MRVLGMALLVWVAACGPMYGGKPEPMAKPKPVAHKEPPPEPLTFKDDCGQPSGPRSKLPTTVVRNSADSDNRVQRGDQKQVEAAAETNVEKKKDLTLASIDNYIRALAADPYNAEATLKLALAYHKTQRKGCALVMLRRLDKLSSHPSFQQVANNWKQEVYDNTAWFVPYRDEALKAIP
jgi:hypothetical protein